MIKMICENCGNQIRKGDNHCSNCGIKLSKSEYKPLQKKYMNKDYKNEEHFYDENNDYYEPEPTEYESRNNYDYEENKRSSGLLPIILFLIIVLIIGFIVGLIMFTSNIQSTPYISI